MRYYTSVVTIPINTAETNAVKINGDSIVGVIMPAAWTAAGLGFAVSLDGSTFVNVYDETAEVRKTQADAGRMLSFTTKIPCPGWVKVRSLNTGTGAGVNQLAARTFYLIVRPE